MLKVIQSVIDVHAAPVVKLTRPPANFTQTVLMVGPAQTIHVMLPVEQQDSLFADSARSCEKSWP